jgi:hypothetical protein
MSVSPVPEDATPMEVAKRLTHRVRRWMDFKAFGNPALAAIIEAEEALITAACQAWIDRFPSKTEKDPDEKAEKDPDDIDYEKLCPECEFFPEGEHDETCSRHSPKVTK